MGAPNPEDESAVSSAPSKRQQKLEKRGGQRVYRDANNSDVFGVTCALRPVVLYYKS